MMANKIELVLIKWDQKLGGVQEGCFPQIQLQSKDAMNIYNLHRSTSVFPGFASVRLSLENGQQYNVCRFLSGFGGTSPDGFTGNYGKNIIGISEKVVGLFLPMDFKSADYWEILMRIASRVLVSPSDFSKRVEKIVRCIEKSNLFDKPEELLEYLSTKLDTEMGLNPADQRKALDLEVKGLHYLALDLKDQVKDLTINPAGKAFVADQQRISQAKEEQENIRTLLDQITSPEHAKDYNRNGR